MQIRSHFVWIAAVMVSVIASGANAQNLTITNARILDGTGRVIERGAVVVRDGKIVSVSAAAPAGVAGRTINAGGKTVMPGLIDAHRHIVTGHGRARNPARCHDQSRRKRSAGGLRLLEGRAEHHSERA